MLKTQIIAIGDGGINPNIPYVDLYIIAQSDKVKPKVCFLPTASGDGRGYIEHFKETFERYPCKPSYLELFSPSIRDIEGFIMDQDIIYVGSGQSKTMMGIWKEWGVDKFLKQAYDNGTIMAGGSAGSVCWFEQCITDSFPGGLSPMPCLSFLPYSNCPHYGSYERRRAYAKFLLNGGIKAGYAADDGAALHFIDGKLHTSVSSQHHAYTYSVKAEDNQIVQERLPTKWLGSEKNQKEYIWCGKAFSGK